MASSQLSQSTFRPILSKLVQTPEFFTPTDLCLAFEHIFTTTSSSSSSSSTPTSIIPDAQIASLLTALHINRLERRPEFLAAVVALLRQRAVKIEVQGVRDDEDVLDIVGTGGDGYNLFNVSTAAAVVVAGCGARVIKHGSRASTSSSGSADILQSLGVSFSSSTPTTTIPRSPNFQFILAPHYHPTLALLGPIRKLLPFRTLFNVTGPLINPARPSIMLVGVAEPGVGAAYARSLREGGVKRAWVVCGEEGLDEVSCAGPTTVWEVNEDMSGDQVVMKTITPEQFGLKKRELHLVKGGAPDENAETFKRLFQQQNQFDPDLEPVADFVCLNAAALLVVAGLAKDERHAIDMARQSILSGNAWKAFEEFRVWSINR